MSEKRNRSAGVCGRREVVSNTPGAEWSAETESAFGAIQKTGRLHRLPAIRLFRRCDGNVTKALDIAKAAAMRKANGNAGFKKAEEGK